MKARALQDTKPRRTAATASLAPPPSDMAGWHAGERRVPTTRHRGSTCAIAQHPTVHALWVLDLSNGAECVRAVSPHWFKLREMAEAYFRAPLAWQTVATPITWQAATTTGAGQSPELTTMTATL